MHIWADRDMATHLLLLLHGLWSQEQEQGLRRQQHLEMPPYGGLVPCAGSDLRAGSPGLEGDRNPAMPIGCKAADIYCAPDFVCLLVFCFI